MEPKKTGKCAVCGTEFNKYRTTDKYCSREHALQDQKQKQERQPKKPPVKINQVSKKQAVLNSKYTVLRIEFLSKPENRTCFIDDCGKIADTVEHIRGRKGFADEWARENNVPLIIDVRFFKPCCLQHNLELENNPELSKKYQLSKIHGGKKE